MGGNRLDVHGDGGVSYLALVAICYMAVGVITMACYKCLKYIIFSVTALGI